MEFYSQFPLRRSRQQSYRDPPRLTSVNQDSKFLQKSHNLRSSIETESPQITLKNNCNQEFTVKFKPKTGRAFSLMLNSFPPVKLKTKQHQVLKSFPQENQVRKAQFTAPDALLSKEQITDKYFKDLRTYFTIKYETPNISERKLAKKSPDINRTVSIKAWDIDSNQYLSNA